MLVKGVNVNVGDLVHILWEDHYSFIDGGWTKARKFTIDPMVCETVGWVTMQNKERLVTVQGHDGQLPTPHVSASASVCPKRMIVSIKVLKKNKRIKW